MNYSPPSWLRTGTYYFVVVLGTLTVVLTLLSLLQNTSAWWLKMLDFPRTLGVVLAVACLAAFALLERHWHRGAWGLVLGLTVALGWQAYFLLPYTPLASVKLPDATPAQAANRAATLHLLQANVLMKNRRAADLLAIIKQADPDVLLLEETNQWWVDAMQELNGMYPYTIKQPTDDTYGMVLYSRYPVRGAQVRFLQHPNVPSFHLEMQLPDGRWFALHTVHPVPPVPSEHPYNKHKREDEVLRVGNLVQQQTGPVLVVGDFNDVSWSHTHRLFQAGGRLCDARVGRGLYATFDAQSLMMRWPLDHIFATPDFRVIKLERLQEFGSDHFPFYAELALP